MRLIDADKEIEKLEKKIGALQEEIRQCYENKNDPYFVGKINFIYNNIIEYRLMINSLNFFETAYDLDELMGGLNKILKDEISQPVADCVYECVQQGFW